MSYKGSCHCGRISFEADGDIGSVVDCNCSICRRKGHLLWFIPASEFRLLSGDGEYSSYLFGAKTISHNFCPVCGCSPFSNGSDDKGNKMVAVNVRCIEDIDLENLETVNYDGRNK